MSDSLVPFLSPIEFFKGGTPTLSSTYRSATIDPVRNVFVPGNPIDLTGATLRFQGYNGDTLLFGRNVSIDPDQTANIGKFTFLFAAGDTSSLTGDVTICTEFKLTEPNGSVSFSTGPDLLIKETLDPTD